MPISLSCLFPGTYKEFHHNIVKVAEDTLSHHLMDPQQFDSVFIKFMINNRTDAWKTETSIFSIHHKKYTTCEHCKTLDSVKWIIKDNQLIERHTFYPWTETICRTHSLDRKPSFTNNCIRKAPLWAIILIHVMGQCWDTVYMYNVCSWSLNTKCGD